MKGIEYVFVYDLQQEKTTISNHLGFIDPDIFDKDDTLIFQHPSYKKKIIAFLVLNFLLCVPFYIINIYCRFYNTIK